MNYRKPGATVAVSLLLAAAFVVAYVLVMDRLLAWTTPASKSLIAAQIAACEARSAECFDWTFRARHWALDSLVGIVSLSAATLPVAVAAALLRLRPWICAVVVAAMLAAFFLFKNFWLLFAPTRMPGWLFIPLAVAITGLAVRAMTQGVARLMFARPPATEPQRV